MLKRSRLHFSKVIGNTFPLLLLLLLFSFALDLLLLRSFSYIYNFRECEMVAKRHSLFHADAERQRCRSEYRCICFNKLYIWSAATNADNRKRCYLLHCEANRLRWLPISCSLIKFRTLYKLCLLHCFFVFFFLISLSIFVSVFLIGSSYLCHSGPPLIDSELGFFKHRNWNRTTSADKYLPFPYVYK